MLVTSHPISFSGKGQCGSFHNPMKTDVISGSLVQLYFLCSHLLYSFNSLSSGSVLKFVYYVLKYLFLVHDFRESGDLNKRKSYLPPDKQFLITRNGITAQPLTSLFCISKHYSRFIALMKSLVSFSKKNSIRIK